MKFFDEEVHNQKRLFSLDLLRAIAITLVVITHIGRVAPFSPLLGSYFGMLGVEIFFVLSGFLIGTIIIKGFDKEEKYGFAQIKHFWTRRWFRTLPNYYLVLIVMVILYSVFYYKSFMLEKLGYLAYFVFLQNTFSPHPGFFNVAWSLAVEEWFYLLFPLVLLVFSKITKTSKYKTLMISTGVFILGIVLLKAFFAISYPSLDFSTVFWKMMPFRPDSIAIGVLLAITYYYHEDFWDKNKNKLLIIGALLFLIASIYLYFDFKDNNNSGILTKIFFFSALSMSIAAMFPRIHSMKRIKNDFLAKIITHISLISYSIYLINHTVIAAASTLPLNGVILVIISLATIFIISTAQYRFFEKPMTKIREKFALNKPKEIIQSNNLP